MPTQEAARRVLIVEDHEMMREAIERRLRATGGFSIVASVGTVSQALGALGAYSPDLVLVDHQLPDGTGLDILSAARDTGQDVTVVALSATEEPALVAEYLASGVDGYVLKTSRAEEFMRILATAGPGHPALDAASASHVAARMRESTARTARTLSAREREVLTLVAEGLSNGRVAARLFVSPETVKTHLDRTFKKLGVHDRAGAVAAGLRRHLIG